MLLMLELIILPFMKTLFSAGYEKETIKQFINKLTSSNVTSVYDVREVPLSRKNGFSKNILIEELKKKNIDYYHFPNLGSPNKLRKKLRKTSNYLRFFKSYRNYLKNNRQDIAKVIKLIENNGESSALMCYEKHPDLCHRSIIASEIIKRKRLRVIPL